MAHNFSEPLEVVKFTRWKITSTCWWASIHSSEDYAGGRDTSATPVQELKWFPVFDSNSFHSVQLKARIFRTIAHRTYSLTRCTVLSAGRGPCLLPNNTRWPRCLPCGRVLTYRALENLRRANRAILRFKTLWHRVCNLAFVWLIKLAEKSRPKSRLIPTVTFRSSSQRTRQNWLFNLIRFSDFWRVSIPRKSY